MAFLGIVVVHTTIAAFVLAEGKANRGSWGFFSIQHIPSVRTIDCEEVCSEKFQNARPERNADARPH
jgi:hypothetical protein